MTATTRAAVIEECRRLIKLYGISRSDLFDGADGRRAWAAAELELLRARYADTPTGVLAKQLGRPTEQVYAKAGHLGLKKGAAFFATDASGRIFKGGRLGIATQFKPGQPSWSKGLKGVVGVQPECRATQFKPGQRPHTWKPVGALRVNADGYLQRKVTDTGYSPRDWVGVHVLVWQAANGPLPPDHVVVFHPGKKTTVLEEITVDRLEAISRRELMARNTVHRYGHEIAQLIRLRGAITRQINKRARNEQDQDA